MLNMSLVRHSVTQAAAVRWVDCSKFSYKTAKPLLYTVYRTRNRKQLGRKWSGKEISFEVVLKDGQHWIIGKRAWPAWRRCVPEITVSMWCVCLWTWPLDILLLQKAAWDASFLCLL